MHDPTSSRRSFVKTGLAGAAIALTSPIARVTNAQTASHKLRLGGPVFDKYQNPDQWILALKKLGYSAAYCPVGANTTDDVIKAYANAAKKARIVIAEVGAWSNPISINNGERQAALKKCRQQLALADRIGAKCCVNISGSRGPKWDGPSEKNLTPETFDLIVQTTRAIIDDVKPTRSFFSLETMPWAYPDSADSYLKLFKAIDRKQFAVHLDPTNLICSPQRYYSNGAIIRECFAKLGPYIKSCHAKDIHLDSKLMTHLDEVRIGLGNLDYVTFLKELSKTGDIPLMLEHLPNAEEYRLAAEHVRAVAKSISFPVI
jgi:sugar phosphate isomerase/epimerase